MSNKKFLLIMMSLLMLIPTGAFAKKSKSSESRSKVMIQGGFDLGLNLPTLSIYNLGLGSKELFDDKADYNVYPWTNSTYVQFGGKAGADFGLYYVTKKNRGIGFMVNIAYNFGGGFHVYTEYRQAGHSDEIIGEKYKSILFSHSVLADINFALKSKMKSSANFAFEVGLRMLPTFNHSYIMDDNWEKKVENSEDKHWYFYVGPNVFFGADIRSGEHFMLTPGFRFAAAFAADPYQSYEDRNDMRKAITYTKYMFAFELKINGYVKK